MKLVKYQPTKPKRPAWPANYRELAEAGTMYVLASQMESMMKKHRYSGQAWQYKSMWKTYRPSGGLVYKSLESLNPKDEQDFWHIMMSNYRAGLPPPSSFSAIFHRVCPLPWPRHSVIAPFRPYVFGAWSKALECRDFNERMYHYDIKSAYRWAACQGLPVMKSGKRIFDIEAEQSVFVVECTERERPPWFEQNVGVMSSEEVRALGIRPRLLFGVHFRDWFDLSLVFAEVEQRFPWCFKRISRAFWGRWNGGEDVQQHGWAHGHKIRLMPNPLHNPVWAHLITSRVKLRLLEAIKQVGVAHVQVDSVLCRDPLPESSDVGGWQKVQEYTPGLWIRETGRWGHGKLIVKRMGLNEREAEQWLIQKSS